ncbi:hypothetical protein PO909_005888 [Leuciscus waleckii]
MHTLYSLALRFCCPLRQLRRSSPPPPPLIPSSVPASGASTPWCVCGMEKEREDEETEGRERPEPLTDVERGIIQDTWARVYETYVLLVHLQMTACAAAWWAEKNTGKQTFHGGYFSTQGQAAAGIPKLGLMMDRCQGKMFHDIFFHMLFLSVKASQICTT